MEEIWKDIIIEKNGEVYDYSGLYQVSNYGRVRSLKFGKVKNMKISKNKCGYITVKLSKKKVRKLYLVHRIVAFAFIENDDPINKIQVNHIDENKENNYVENLEWVTPKENTNHGTAIERRSKKASKTIKKKYEDGYISPVKGRPKTEKQKEQFAKLRETQKGNNSPKAVKVVCIETGQVFGCIREAEDWCGKGGITSCCQGRNKTAGGYHWQYLDDYLREQRMQSDINNSKQLAA